jgi:hypothetical protein
MVYRWEGQCPLPLCSILLLQLHGTTLIGCAQSAAPSSSLAAGIVYSGVVGQLPCCMTQQRSQVYQTAQEAWQDLADRDGSFKSHYKKSASYWSEQVRGMPADRSAIGAQVLGTMLMQHHVLSSSLKRLACAYKSGCPHAQLHVWQPACRNQATRECCVVSGCS